MIDTDRELCTGCGDCVAACPTGAIYLVEGKAYIDHELCTECGGCVSACRNGAVRNMPAPVERLVSSLRPTSAHSEAGPFSPLTPTTSWKTAIVPAMSVTLQFLGRRVVPHMVDALLQRLHARGIDRTGHSQEREGEVAQDPDVREDVQQRGQRRHQERLRRRGTPR